MEATTQKIIDELLDLAIDGKTAKLIRDFTFNALSSEQVLQTTNPEAISKLYRIIYLLEEATKIGEE